MRNSAGARGAQKEVNMRIDLPDHRLYLVLHTHRHGLSTHFLAVPGVESFTAADAAPFVEDYDPTTEEIEVRGPIVADDVRVLDSTTPPDLRPIDPRFCGCAECQVGIHVPLEMASFEHLTDFLKGNIVNNTGIDVSALMGESEKPYAPAALSQAMGRLMRYADGDAKVWVPWEVKK